MLAIVLSLAFGIVAFAALAVIHASFVTGLRRAREIRRELRGSPPRVAFSRSVALPAAPSAALRVAA